MDEKGSYLSTKRLFKMEWSIDQKKVIDSRNSSLLVTASAGSGKTTVMVERILKFISDPESDVSLDNMLIMTFTRAAASDMKEKIRILLDKKIADEPDNSKLKLQKLLLPMADISTIHSYCQRLIKDHYEDLGLDPDIRVADQDEIALIKKDVLSDIFEEKFARNENQESGFIKMMETFSLSNMDERAANIIEGIYQQIVSAPWPRDVLRGFSQECEKEQNGEYEETRWFKYLVSELKRDVKAWRKLLVSAKSICESQDGPLKYRDSIMDAICVCDRILNESGSSYEALKDHVDQAKIGGGRITDKDQVDPAKKDYVLKTRKDFRSFIKKLGEDLFILKGAEQTRATIGTAIINKELLEMTGKFLERFNAAKRERNVMDYDDMEHLALRLLYNEDHETPSALADTLSGELSVIMIDEYQDSSFIQESLIRALSKERFGIYNVFMVGDVKQSIYGFRNAKPELFTEKLDIYLKDENAPYRKIELNENYRSRREVLDATNDVFSYIMGRDLGEIEYDEDACLKYSSSYPDYGRNSTEIFLLDTAEDPEESGDSSGKSTEDLGKIEKKSIEDLWKIEEKPTKDPGKIEKKSTDDPRKKEQGTLKEADNNLAGMSKDELEFCMIAMRINELMKVEDRFRITDRDQGTMRDISFKDIVILLRKSTHAEELKNILEANGIPAYFDNSRGYFELEEVRLIMNLLKIVDNPLQDIPLVACMRSFIGAFTDEELSWIEIGYQEQRRASLRKISHEQPGFEEKTPANQDPDEVDTIKSDISQMSGDFYRALLACSQRKDESTLRKKAQDFLSMLNHFRFLAGFVSVSELLNRIYTETGYYSYLASLPDGDKAIKNLDTLLIKAQNYGKTNYQGIFNFVRYIEDLEANKKDGSEPEPITDHGDKVRISTIHKAKGLEYPVVILALSFSNFAGNNKEKSVLFDELGIGSDYIDLETNIKYPGLKKAFFKRKHLTESKAEEERILYVAMTRAMEKLIITGALDNTRKKVENLTDPSFISGGNPDDKYPRTLVMRAKTYMDWILATYAHKKQHFDLRLYTLDDLRKARNEKEISKYRGNEDPLGYLDEEVRDDSLLQSISAKEITNILNAKYPFDTETRLKPKISVSYIKGAQYEKSEIIPKIPDVDEKIPKPEEGALRGTAFHRAMKLLNFSGTPQEEWEELMQNPRFQKSLKERLDEDAVRSFLKSPIFCRMCQASKRGELFREQHFMLGIPARELLADQDSDELQILQGIIDAYFIENGGIILLDYKTDRALENVIKERYDVQLQLYARALEELRGLDVKEIVIYSTFLNREIVLK